ncbi:cytochrome c-type biogenesis protein CcmH [Poseidonocella pacifica]|uniref:Cytochrome c-type biogenesis protein CcmH n=1 Tax=Poseidonocella pacifica TaxID=871651 RepID=A0A1I0V0W5_9RHOB|nr:c-type cytochrome biogenesis protein CcmI [Poseidonocella pacifica]SFA69941.1 cytochrome c-type biogenesis protein CcmH [Poseidonocella pacifica]
MDFWITSIILALVIGGLLALALLRSRADAVPAESFDLKVYRDQLLEVDRDLARGVVAPEDAERVRAEVSRRILSADAALQEKGADRRGPFGLSRAVAAIIVLLVVGGTFALYSAIGAPGYSDQSLAARKADAESFRQSRPDQETAEAQVPSALPPLTEPSEDYLSLMDKLRLAVLERPDDLQGHLLLARNEAALGNFRAAHQAQGQVLRLRGNEATAKDYVDYADLLVLAAGGYVSPEAETALGAALARDPNNGTARYYLGLMQLQTGRPDQSFTVWNRLLRESDPSAPWVAPIRQQIEGVAQLAGVDFTPPELPEPTVNQMQEMSELSPEDRAAMIEGMVAGLSSRLAEEGGSPAEWARLITALGVLGRDDEARTILDEARSVFASNPGALAEIQASAKNAGLVP